MLVIRGDGVCWIGRVDVSTLAESSGEPKAGDDRGDRLFGAGRSIRGVVYMARENVESVRELYAETYNKYQKFPKGNVVSNTLEVEQKGNVLSGKSTLLVKNQGDQELSEIILYLNPALVVSAIQEGETDVSFERENQVIRVARKLLPGEEVELTVEYRGGIDERVCYLDVDFDKLFQLQPIPGHSSTAGKRFALSGMISRCLPRNVFGIR